MDNFTEQDWKLFRTKFSKWQENYMGRLNKEYLEIQIAINYLLKNFGNLKKEYLMTKNMLV